MKLRAAWARRLLLVALGTAALGTASCTEISQAGVAELAAALQQVENAPYLVAHSGVRRYEVYGSTAQGGATSLVYWERVATDGKAGCDIEVISVETPLRAGLDVFQLVQSQRETFTFRYRDFLIRDLARFAANYSIEPEAATVQVAGRECFETAFQRTDGSLRYLVATDASTGLVLRYEVRDLVSGQLLSRLEYHGVDFAPDLSAHSFKSVAVGELSIQPLEQLEPILGAPVGEPALIPEGYALHERSLRTSGDGRTFVLSSYDDGLETLFLLQGPADVPPHGGQQVAAVKSLGSKSDAVAGDVALWAQEGAWTVLQYRLGSQLFIALGKLEAGELLLFLESALP